MYHDETLFRTIASLNLDAVVDMFQHSGRMFCEFACVKTIYAIAPVECSIEYL